MTLAEFKSWFEGFAAALDGPPNERQWEEIKRKVEELDSQCVGGIPLTGPYRDTTGVPPISCGSGRASFWSNLKRHLWWDDLREFLCLRDPTPPPGYGQQEVVYGDWRDAGRPRYSPGL